MVTHHLCSAVCFVSGCVWLSFIVIYLFLGVQILDRTTVQQVLVEKGQVTAVETDRGSIECEYFVNCAGQVKNVTAREE